MFPGVKNFKRRKRLLEKISEVNLPSLTSVEANELPASPESSTYEMNINGNSHSSDAASVASNASTMLYLSDDEKYSVNSQRAMTPIMNRKDSFRDKFHPLKRHLPAESGSKPASSTLDSKCCDMDMPVGSKGINLQVAANKIPTSSVTQKTNTSNEKVVVSQRISPSYIIYQDPELLAQSANNVIDNKNIRKLIRSQFECMVATSMLPPFKRMPKTDEVEEMAKSLVVFYPCLRDPESGHGVIFEKLKTRKRNFESVKKKQGPTPQRSSKKRKVVSEQNSNKAIAQLISEDIRDRKDPDSDDSLDKELVENAINEVQTPSTTSKGMPKEIMQRHYDSLTSELKKKKPCEKTVKLYLDEEFQSRREWLLSIPKEQRLSALFDKYPCFSRIEEIINEAGRIMKKENFLEKSKANFLKEIDNIVFFAIAKRDLSPPKPTLGDKTAYILRQINIIFPSKRKSSNDALLIDVKREDDPEDMYKKDGLYIMRHQGEAMVMCGKKILTRICSQSLHVALIAMLSIYYVLDADYPRSCEAAFLQFLIFEVYATPKDLVKTIDKHSREYFNYKCPEEVADKVCF